MTAGKTDSLAKGVYGLAQGLTDKQSLFVAEYLVDRNATQAAIRAGYSPKTAEFQASRLLSNVKIRAAVDQGLMSVAERVGITAERVLRERGRLAFFDPRKLFDASGNPLPIQDLDEETAAAIVGVEVVEMKGGEAIPGVLSYVRKYRLAGKDNSLAALEKYLGLTEKPMRFALPRIESTEDCTTAQAAVLTAVAAGQLMLTEAKVMSDLIDGQRRAYETHDLAKRLEAIEEAMRKKGGQA